MDRISGLSDELLIKILSFVPTKIAVSTSILSKRWEFLWMWISKLEFEVNNYESGIVLGNFINKNLPLLKSPVLESFRLHCYWKSFDPDCIQHWVELAASRCISELDFKYIDLSFMGKRYVLLPSSLYTCESLVTLKLTGRDILVDVPRNVSLPSLKNLLLFSVTYKNQDSLRLLLSYCPVLEDLTVFREETDNAKGIVVISRSLQRLTLNIYGGCLEESVIVAPSLKCFVVDNFDERFSYWVAHMPKVEEVELDVKDGIERLFESITSVKHLLLCIRSYDDDKIMYRDGIYFSQLEHLTLCIRSDYWSKFLLRLLKDAPKLRVLNLYTNLDSRFGKYEPASWNNNQGIVPECLLESLKTFEFEGYSGRQEERDVVSFILKHACRLKSSSIKPHVSDAETSSSIAST